MDDIKAKQQVVEKIKASTNILVTVSNDPSVDALTAALGLTLTLEKLGKYGTAIFSGQIPSAMEFLEPEKTFDTTTDSLRDFIIALNKEKADHLRYKIDGDVVKIFITPYKTTISQDDLEFTQGDVNVELIIALGVDNQEHLDGALENHGQVLHDATVLTMTVGEQTSALGGIDWHDPQSSSLSEMVAGLAEALKESKDKPLIDAPIATALLTGIVAQTDRFSNSHTTSKTMNVAAELMGAGADQQLISFKLEESHEISETSSPAAKTADTSDSSPKDSLSINHAGETLTELETRVKGDEPDAESAAEPVVEPSSASTPDGPVKVTSAYALDEAPAQPEEEAPASGTEPAPELAPVKTSTEAASASNSEEIAPMASHSYITGEPSSAYALDATEERTPEDPTQSVSAAPFPGAPEVAPGSVGVNNSTPTPTDLGLPLPPPLPDFSSSITPPPAFPVTPSAQPPERLGDILAPEPSAVLGPSLPPADTLTPQPTPAITLEPTPSIVPPAPPVTPPNPAPGPADPGQFKIPGSS